MNRISKVLVLTVLFISCAARAFIAGVPSTAAVAKVLQIAMTDPEIKRSIARAGEALPELASHICLESKTVNLFTALQDMSSDTAGADKHAAILRSKFVPQELDVSKIQAQAANDGSEASVREAGECDTGVEVARLWVSISPVIGNPYARSDEGLGFFVEVRVQSPRGVIVDRYIYWAALENQGKKRSREIKRVVRVTTGMDNIATERMTIYP